MSEIIIKNNMSQLKRNLLHKLHELSTSIPLVITDSGSEITANSKEFIVRAVFSEDIVSYSISTSNLINRFRPGIQFVNDYSPFSSEKDWLINNELQQQFMRVIDSLSNGKVYVGGRGSHAYIAWCEDNSIILKSYSKSYFWSIKTVESKISKAELRRLELSPLRG